jgi:hypothetical protein
MSAQLPHNTTSGDRLTHYQTSQSLALEDLREHPEYLQELFQTIAKYEEVKKGAYEWTHRFIKQLATEKNLPPGAWDVIETLVKVHLLEDFEVGHLAIRAIKEGHTNTFIELYGLVSDVNRRIEGKSALHWACLYGQPEIVKQLTEWGASWKHQDGEGAYPLELIEGKELYKELRELEALAFPPGITHAALEQFQNFHTVSPSVVTTFFTVFNEDPIPKGNVTWMQDNQEMVLVIFQRKYSLSPNDPGIAKGLDACRHLRLDIPNLQDAARKFESYQTTKSMAHMIGDTFIRGRQENERELEGHKMSSTIPYMQVMLERVLAHYPDRLDHSTMDQINKLYEELTPVLQRAMEMEALSFDNFLDEDATHVQKRVRQCAQGLLDDLTKLPPRESIFLPWGWSSEGSGHAMLLHFERGEINEWTITVLNTGDGMSFSDGVMQGSKRKLPFFTVFDRITDKELLELPLMEAFLEPMLLIGKTVKQSKDFGAADLYVAVLQKNLGHRRRELNPEEKKIGAYITGQRSGTCAMRVLFAFLKLRVGPDAYKKLKHLLHLETAEVGYHVNRKAFRVKKEPQFVLLHGTRNIARQALKLYRSGLLTETEFRVSAQRIRSLWMEMETNILSTDRGQVEDEKPTATILGKHHLTSWFDKLQVSAWVQELETKTPDPFLQVTNKVQLEKLLFSPQTAQELTQSLRSWNSVLKDLPYPSAKHVIRNLLLSLPFPEQAFLKSIQNLSAGEAQTLLSELYAALETENKISYDKEADGLLAAQMAYALAHAVACHIDQSTGANGALNLAQYKVDPRPLQYLKNSYSFALADPQREKKMQQLECYFQTFAKARYPPLFSFVGWQLGKAGPMHSRTTVLSLPPPRGSSEQLYLNDLERGVRDWLPYSAGCPKETRKSVWERAQLFHQLTPEKKHIVQFRDICLQSRLRVLGKYYSFGNWKAEGSEWDKDKVYWGDSYRNTVKKVPSNIMDQALRDLPKQDPENKVLLQKPVEEHSVKTIRTEPELALPRLVQHFEEHLDDFGSRERQILFFETLFHLGAHQLDGEVKRNPLYVKRLYALLENVALPYFEERLRTQTEGTDLLTVAQAVAFLLTVQGRVAVILNDDSFYQRTVEKFIIFTSPTNPYCPQIFREASGRRLVSEAFLQVLLIKEQWTEEEAMQALICCAASAYAMDINHTELKPFDKPWEDPRREHDVNSLPWRRGEDVENALRDSGLRQQTLCAMVRAVEIAEPCGSWNGEYPIYQASLLGPEGVVLADIEVNVLSGAVRRNGVLVNQENYSQRYDFLGRLKNFSQNLFAYVQQDLMECPTLVRYENSQSDYHKTFSFFNHSGDPILSIIKDGDDYLLEVSCRGRPFRFSAKWHNDVRLIKKHFPIRFQSEDLLYGVSSDGGPKAVLVITPELQPVGILQQDGKWIQNPQNPDSFPTKITINQSLSPTEESNWEENESEGSKRVRLKKFSAAKGEFCFVEFSKESRELPDGKRVEKLVWIQDKSYSFSDNQQLSGMGSRSDYVILEDSNGLRKVLFIESGSVLYELDPKNRPMSNRPEVNATFAKQAMKQGEYLSALHFLDQMTISDSFNEEALLTLKHIFQPQKADAHPNAYALRLVASYLAIESLKRKPILLVDLEDPKKEQLKKLHTFWVGLSKDRDDLLAKCFTDYFSLENNINQDLRLSNSIGAKVFGQWLFSFISSTNNTNPLLLQSCLQLTSPEDAITQSVPLSFRTRDHEQASHIFLRWRDMIPQKKGGINSFEKIFPKLRPGSTFIKAFDFLYRKATEGAVEEKHQVRQTVAFCEGDDTKELVPLRLILEAILFPETNPQLAKDIHQLVEKIRNNTHTPSGWYSHPNVALERELQTLLVQWKKAQERAGLKTLPTNRVVDELKEKLAKASGKLVETPLPEKPPGPAQGNIDFTTSFSQARYKEVLQLLHEIPGEEHPISKIPEQSFDSSFLKTRFASLNEDYAQGQIKNQKTKHSVDRRALPEAINKMRDSLKNIDLAGPQNEILLLARSVRKKTLEEDIQAMEIVGGWRGEITLDDCILSFLRQDSGLLSQKNPHLSLEDADLVRAKVGEYLLKAVEKWRLRQCIEQAEKVLGNQNQALDDDLITLFRETLEDQLAYDPRTLPALLVFEYYGSEFLQKMVRLRSDQVAGIQEMLARDENNAFQSLSLQLIMGAGKTFVFGTVMALLKADGYHLSVHVPPAALFATNSSEMLQRVRMFFQQKGHALHFLRAPEYFTPTFLTDLYNALHRAVLNREVILAAPETILSIRNRYIEMRDHVADLYQASGNSEEIRQAVQSLEILEKVIKLLKQRGVATLDEIDVTLAANKEHNFPIGERKPLDQNAIRLIEQIFYLSATDPEVGPKLGLVHNAQSHLNLESRKELCRIVAGKFIDHLTLDPRWKDRFLLYTLPPKEQQDVKEQLVVYFMDKDLPPPEWLVKLHKSNNPQQNQLAEYLVLARKELGDWLPQGWQRNLNEHYGRSHADENYELARPYVANNTPNETSEFADRWEMINRTFHTYLVEGMNKNQVKAWISLLREKAGVEWKRSRGAKPLDGVLTAKEFEELIGIDLFTIDTSNEETIQKVQDVLTSGSQEVIKTLLKMTRKAVLGKVEVPARQVSANAQSLCSMFGVTQGYAGTMENSDTFPDAIRVQRDVGTNGQTIDLLHQKNNTFHHLKNEKVILAKILSNHPEAERVHAIIDVGSYFRGMTNLSVAQQIAQFYSQRADDPKYAKIKGVLYFDEQENNWPKFIRFDQPDPISLPSTDPQIIALTTGLSKEEIFSYYDQRNITGMDLKQTFDAIAITTISENTTIRELLQGVRRMRELDYSQRVEFAVTDAVRALIETKLQRPISEEDLNVHDLIAFTEINETEQLLRYNLAGVMQKLVNAAQDSVLEAIFAKNTQSEKNRIFAATRQLFVKVLQDELYALYAEKAEMVETTAFLNQMRETYLQLVSDYVGKESASRLDKEMRAIIDRSLEKKMLPLQIDAGLAGEIGRENTMEQEQSRRQEQEQKQEQKKEVSQLVQDSRPVFRETEWGSQAILSPHFPKVSKGPSCDLLGVVLKKNRDFSSYADIFTSKIDLTNNFQRTSSYSDRILTSSSKVPQQVMAIRKNEQWRFVLLSIYDAAQLRQQVEKEGKNSPFAPYLLHPDGKIVSDGIGDWDPDWLSDPTSELSQGLVEIMILEGNIDALSSEQWLPAVQHWLCRGDAEKKQAFIEQHILSTPRLKEAYEHSDLQKAVAASSEVETEALGVSMVLLEVIRQIPGDFVTLQYYLDVLNQAKIVTEELRSGILEIALRIIDKGYQELEGGLDEEPIEGYHDTVWNEEFLQNFFRNLRFLEGRGHKLMIGERLQPLFDRHDVGDEIKTLVLSQMAERDISWNPEFYSQS